MAVNTTTLTINGTLQSPSIHTMSVNRHYPMLEDNLKQLHDIVEAVQHMKDANVGALSMNSQASQKCKRVSCSCPSLNESSLAIDGIRDSAPSSPSQIDLSLSLNTSYVSPSFRLNDSSTWKNDTSRIMKLSNSDANDNEILRRRSWAALEGLFMQREVHRKINKQRSVSLSDLESDTGDILMETDGYNNLPKTASAVHQRLISKSTHLRPNQQGSSNGSTASSISTHSLNEADVFIDFIKIRLKREEEISLPQVRPPLQKSVSTPSILAVATGDNTSCSYDVNERSTGDTDADVNAATTTCYISSKSTADGNSSYTFDDRPEKPRKRGSSLFFRKKKEKSKKDSRVHLWTSTNHNNTSSIVLCDWCSKPVESKYTRRCSCCHVTVHQGVCVHHISATECHQIPKPSSKAPRKQTSNQTQNKTGKKNTNLATIGHVNSLIINEEKENSDFVKNQPGNEDHHHIIDYSEDVPLITQEFLNEEQIGPGDLDTDPFLGLQDEEPDTWTPTVNKEILKNLNEKEIKRQEHIYEFVLTEKHHCLTLILMQKIFVDGLKKHFQLGPNLRRMFPRLAELTDIHLRFLHSLRRRQREGPVVNTISDILLEQFSGDAAINLKSVYGEFCSRYRDSVSIYKYYLSENSGFTAFVKHCQNNPLLKKKGIPECILFVTQRLTKYPLLIEPLIKTSKENKQETDLLTKALALVRSILTDVNAHVAEKEKEDRKLEIYNKTDPKSCTLYRGNKFKKSDILNNNRKLRFEGQAQLMQGRTKWQPVHVIVLSDVLLFLVENNNKFAFYTPDDKAGVIGLQKLLVREQAGSDNRSIFLISSNPSEPEMFELKIQRPKETAVWINSIREAVQNCPVDDQMFEESPSEEQQRQLLISQAYMHQIVGNLRQKDVEQALIYEEKIVLLQKLLSTVGVDVGVEVPSYRHLVSDYLDGEAVREHVFSTIQKVHEITSAFYNCGTNLSRSASSVGEHQSNVYVSPILPKRAETFGGFDNALSCKGFVAGTSRKLSQQFQKEGCDIPEGIQSSPVSSPVSTPEMQRNAKPSTSSIIDMTTMPQAQQYVTCNPKMSSSQLDIPPILQLEAEQQSAVVLLTSHMYSLASIIAQQMSSINSLEAQLMFCRQELNQPSGEKERKPIYKLNQQLEELRNLQDKLTQEKQQWQRERDAEHKELEEKRKQLQKLQEQVRLEQEDVMEQREQLYRKLEAVSSQGLVNAANPPLLMLSQPGPLQSPNTTTSPSSLLVDLTSGGSTSSLPIPSSTLSSSPSNSWKRRNDSLRWSKSSAPVGNVLPLNLISATNQQKVASNVQIKQKLPLKLAAKPEKAATNLGSGSSGVVPAAAGISTTSSLSAVSHLCSSSTIPSNSSNPKAQQTKGTSFLRKSTPRLLHIKLSSPKDNDS